MKQTQEVCWTHYSPENTSDETFARATQLRHQNYLENKNTTNLVYIKDLNVKLIHIKRR